MFDVVHKPTGKVFTVYEVHGEMFLVYSAVEYEDVFCWRFISMSECVPVGGEWGCTTKTL